MDTPVGAVPVVATRLSTRDRVQTVLVRTGLTRNNYKVNPGLYAVGDPTKDSPVICTANYKLTFDAVRNELAGQDAWLLVADTRGINVWCAAGKQLFSTDEVAHRVRTTRLADVVAHRRIILPQLAATGVNRHALKKRCGFGADFGPVRARDLPAFIRDGNQADETMRTVTFTLKERAELVPVELFLIWKLLAWVLVAGFLLSGIGPDLFSIQAAWHRGLAVGAATLLGVAAGAGLVPLLLPWLPWRQFWLKGLPVGLMAGLLNPLLRDAPPMDGLTLVLWTCTVASFLAMNFTGSTPFTSPSGVEQEMKRAIPAQAAATVLALTLWLIEPFLA